MSIFIKAKYILFFITLQNICLLHITMFLCLCANQYGGKWLLHTTDPIFKQLSDLGESKFIARDQIYPDILYYKCELPTP